MADNYSEHVSNLRRLAVTLQGVIAAADAMEKIGSIENAITEAERARSATLDAKRQAEEEFEATKNAIAQNNLAAAVTIADAKKEVEARLQRADAEAEKAVSDAKEVARQAADRITTERNVELNRLLDEIERQRGELFTLNGQVLAARAEAEDAERVRAEKQKALDAINESIAKLHPVRL
ncbi:MAG: hypothetical protein Q7R68_10925 [Nitrospirales bacterium]|nr:hypothetical protein [Nitrospirales bacterium]